MPDLTIETRRTCACNIHWQVKVPGSGKNVYVVRYGETPAEADFQMDYSCDCKAFEFGGGKHCKHIIQVKGDRCEWGAGAFAGDRPEPNGDLSCPECGGPTEVILVGV